MLYWSAFGINLPRVRKKVNFGAINRDGSEIIDLRLSSRRWSLLRLEYLVRVSNLHKTLQQQSVRQLRADITVFSWTITLQEVLAFPTVILDLDGGHTIPLLRIVLPPS